MKIQTTTSNELGAVATTQRTPANHGLNYTQTAQQGNTIVAYAISYAAVGFLPFPLAANSKVPSKGSNGFKDALSNPAEVAKLFANHRGNIGLTFGADLFAIDLDVKHGNNAIKTFEIIAAQNGGLPATLTARTPSGGLHHIFRKPANIWIQNTANILASGIDTRTSDGYIVAEPSAVDGKSYQWLDWLPTNGGMPEIADAPVWLLKLLATWKRAPTTPATNEGGKISEGGRNAALFSNACAMRRCGFDEEAIIAALVIRNEKDCNPPLPESELKVIAHSAGKYPPNDSAGSRAGGNGNAPPMPPEPLPALPSVLPFDYHYLPDTLRGYVKDISERMQCPPDFAAVAVLVMMATIIGRKVGIRPKRQDDWTVIPNLWAAAVGNSGVMKSPTLAAAMFPIKKLQSAAYEAFNKAKAEYDAQGELAKLQQSVNKSEAKKALKGNKSADVKGLLQSSDAGDAPILKRYITNNASYEALGEIMIENPNGLLVESDEIIGLLKQLDASGQEVARSFYLTAADGDKPYTFDRIMRGKGLHIDALCLSIIGGIQPGVLAEYVRQATSGGVGADGLLQRFGLMVYPDVSPDWKNVDRYPDSTLREAVNLLAEKLDNLNHEEIGAEFKQFPDPINADDGQQYGGVPFLRFDDEAQVLFTEWRASLEIRLRSGEEHPAIVSHLSKYRKLIPSLALINHLCDTGRGAVTKEALQRSIAFSEYLESHAQRIYSFATRPDIDAAKTLLKRLASGKLPDVFKARDIYQKGWAGLENPSKAQSAINLLLEYHHLSEEEIKDTGGRPTTHYHWIKEGANYAV